MESPGGEGAVSTEVLRVERPFSSTVEVLAGEPPGDDRLSRRATRFGVLVVESEASTTRIAVPPALAGSDVRFDFLLEDASRDGVVLRRGTRRVAGRSCQVYRAGGPVSAGELVPVGEGDGEHADVCIDADGLVLEEEWFDGDRLLRRRRAVAVDSKIDLSGSRFVLPGEQDLTVEAGNGVIRPLQADEQSEAMLFRLASPPKGFRLHGRFAVTHPRLGAPDAARRPPVSGAAEVWVRGADLIVLEQGVGDNGAGAPDHPYGREVDLGALGRGQAILDLRGNEVRVDIDGEAYLRLYGTVPIRELLTLAKSLRRA